MKTAILYLALMSLSFAAPAKTLTIAIDLSGSNPLLAHENFAHMAAVYVEKAISELQDGDTLRMQSFGARDSADNILRSEVRINRRNRAGTLAAQVGAYIRAVPKSRKDGQSATNLIAWLDFSGRPCNSGDAIVVITDGLESSSLVSAQDLVDGKAGLPKPAFSLEGCDLTFYGLGLGWPYEYARHVRSAWNVWAGQAGAKFTAIVP